MVGQPKPCHVLFTYRHIMSYLLTKHTEKWLAIGQSYYRVIKMWENCLLHNMLFQFLVFFFFRFQYFIQKSIFLGYFSYLCIIYCSNRVLKHLWPVVTDKWEIILLPIVCTATNSIFSTCHVVSSQGVLVGNSLIHGQSVFSRELDNSNIIHKSHLYD